MNIHLLHGRLARDPEFTPGPEASRDRTNFTVATDRRYGDEADFFDCVIFGKRAAVIDKYFKKGSEIVVSGEGQLRKYTDKNGVDRKSYSILVNDFNFCGSRSNGTASQETGPEPYFKETDEEIVF